MTRACSLELSAHHHTVENKVILTVSLGSARTWIMTKRPPHGAKSAAKKSGKTLPKSESHTWTLDTGSLLLMQGDTQKQWYHEIPKQAKVKEGRIVSRLAAVASDTLLCADRLNTAFLAAEYHISSARV